LCTGCEVAGASSPCSTPHSVPLLRTLSSRCEVRARGAKSLVGFALRHVLPQAEVTAILDAISLYDMPRSLFYEAGILAGQHLRSLDALHLAAAVRLGVDVVVSYDNRMLESAADIGLNVLAVSGHRPC
jgi:hypothetical protein